MAIHRCRIRKVAGSTEKVYQLLLREEETIEKQRIHDIKKRKEAEQFINRFRAKASKARAVQSRIKALQKKEQPERLSSPESLEFSFPAAPFTGRRLMEVQDLSFRFDEESPFLIDGLSFSVEKTDRIGIIGKNGKGKSTLLNLLAGELTPLGGAVRHHKDLTLAFFGQMNINRLNLDNTVEDEILLAHPERNRRMSRSICGAMMFPGDHALKKISVLSGGERSRVLLGRLLVRPANLLLLDEPTNHLDMDSTESLLEAVHNFPGAVIIVTHSEMILHSLVTRLIVFDDNRVALYYGTYGDFLSRAGWKDEKEQSRVTSERGRRATPFPKRAIRRVRAKLIHDKSRTLRTLKSSIDGIEDEIMRLEEKTEEETRELLDASLRGDGNTIETSAKALHSARERIEALFAELERLQADFDRKKKEYEEKLSAFMEPDD